ncbi:MULTISPECIES: hypothetical protein [Sorangium]|uniref:hypothetical protein n=1 Tax=Sorangium TaxID=39643 RepID=UPI003D9C081B
MVQQRPAIDGAPRRPPHPATVAQRRPDPAALAEPPAAGARPAVRPPRPATAARASGSAGAIQRATPSTAKPRLITKEILAILSDSLLAARLLAALEKHLGKGKLVVVEDDLGSLAVRGDADMALPYVVRVNSRQNSLVQAITAAHEVVHLLQYATGQITKHSTTGDTVLAEIPAKCAESVVYFELLDMERETYPTLPAQQQMLLDVTRDDAFRTVFEPDAFLLQQYKVYYPKHTRLACKYSDVAIRNMMEQSPFWAEVTGYLKEAKDACPIV